MAKPDYKKILAKNPAAKPTPEYDVFTPFVVPQAETPAVTKTAPRKKPTHVRQEPVASTKAEVPRERPVYLTEVDKTENRIAVGHSMFPSRQRQLNDMAYEEGRKQWLILDQAIEEYVERHHPNREKK